jgi:hypothetical protein
MFENRVLKIGFGFREKEIIIDQIQLHNVEFNDLYSAPYFTGVIS